MAGPVSAEGRWITHPIAPASDAKRGQIALQFRRELNLAHVPATARVRVSADNRYALFVNGKRAAAGPARGDLSHWRYRSIDIAPLLRPGKNVLAAEVWNDGSASALAQISARTGFFLEGETGQLDRIDTGPDWQVRVDASRTLTPGTEQLSQMGLHKYYAAAPAETHDAAEQRPDWLATSTTAADWVNAIGAVPEGQASPWTLVEDRLPPMTYDPAPAGRLVRVSGIAAARFPDHPVTIPANTDATLLIDAGAVQAAYPALTVGGGRGAEIRITYTEALYGPDKNHLRDRAQIAGGTVLGLTDTFRADGSRRSVFQPFWWRTWRFAELRVKTGAAPLRLESFRRYATGYPFTPRGHFRSGDPELNRIWQVGWDTVQLDAHETFMDTAYWEQLQYVGDTRIEALVTYLASGDARLAVQAIEAIDDSKVDGLPQSRWPSNSFQSIPPFALLWIGMLHDYWLHEPDQAPLRRSLAGARSVLEWYRRYVGADGLVGVTPGWEFIDWRPTLSNYPSTTDPKKGEPCIISLMYLGALQQAADLENGFGDAARADAERAEAQRLSKAVNDRCWSPERGLYADTPERTAFSQHANVLAVLYDVAPRAAQTSIIDRITVRNGGIAAPDGVTPTTSYFAFYLARALDHAGLGDRYVELLQSWRDMLAQNFTTWPEKPDPSRSDSHAWSAHPTADLLTIVAGIQAASSGFRTVRIAPNLGTLRKLDAAAAHPAGLIETHYSKSGRTLRASIRLPANVSGQFVWNGRSFPLHPGRNALKIADRAEDRIGR
jgi:hypothetical protein